jgi:hypothetical protein
VVLWTAKGAATSIKLARSRDGGLTFSSAEELQMTGAPGDRGWPALAVGPDGTARALWLDHRGLAVKRPPAAHAGVHDGVAMAQRSALYFASAAGRPSGEREVARGVCYCCKTALAIGADGVIYAAWRHVYPGNIRDIAFAVSRDGGRTFSAPARVSEDGWEIHGCPDDGPAIAVDGKGIVHVVWPTVVRRGKDLEGALFYASTTDGKRFTPRMRIATLGGPKPSHPQLVVQGGRVVVAWDEQHGGRRVAAVRAWRPGTGQPVIEMLNAGGAGSYPVLAATDGGIVAAWTSGASGASTIAVGRVSSD